MSRLTLTLTGLLVAFALFASGCPEPEQPKTCSPAAATWGYDATADACELKESCDSDLAGDYPSELACREDRGLADAGAGEDADGGPTDGGMEDADEATDGGEDTGGDTGGSDDISEDTATDTEPADDTSQMDVAETGPSPDDGGETGTDAAPSCASQGKTACFSNNDCNSGERCEDISNTSTPLPCCVAGERGMKKAGETCDSSTGQFECESGVCIGGSSGPSRCSTTCQSKEDCPENMKNCQPVFGSGSSKKWCFPT
jgi:hypothetical protein